MAFTKHFRAGLDNNGGLWVWGESTPAAKSDEFYHEPVCDQDERSLSHKIKWFSEKDLKVVDIEAGSKALIVKTVHNDTNQQSFYGIPFRAADHKNIPEPKDEDDEDNAENEVAGEDADNAEESKAP